MQNKLTDLNNHLFMQLERLSDEDLNGPQLEIEINRSKAITSVANQIISNAALALDAQKLIDNRENANTKLPSMLEE